MIGLRPWIFLVIVALVAAMPVESALAQETDEFGWFRLSEVSGFLLLGTRLENETRTREGADTSWDSERLEWEQMVNTELEGSVYHPRLLRFLLSAELRLIQDFGAEAYRVMPGGLWRFLFLKSKPYNMRVYGSVRRAEVERAFARTYTVDSQVYGAAADYRADELTLNLTAEHTALDRTDMVGSYSEVRDELSASARYKEPDYQAKGDYILAFDEIAGIDLRRQELRARTMAEFGKDPEDRGKPADKTLWGTLRLSERVTSVAHRYMVATGQFRWRHTRRLQSFYRTDVSGAKSGPVWNAGVDLSSGLSHRLYDSLTTKPEIGGHYEKASHGDFREVRARVNEAYTKRLSSWGALSINLIPGLSYQENRPAARTGFVSNEPHQIPDLEPVTLRQPDALIDTVLVYTPDARVTYVRDRDYTLTERGPFVELTRLATGDIAVGEMVLVNYDYITAGDYDTLISHLFTQVMVRFHRYYAVYAQNRLREHTLLGGDQHPRFFDENLSLFGGRLNRKWINANAELQRSSATIGSYWGHSQSLSLTPPSLFDGRLRGSIGAARAERHFRDDDEDFTGYSVHSQVSGGYAQWHGQLRADYRRERWTGSTRMLANDIDAWGLRAIVRRQLRSTHLELDARTNRIRRYGQLERELVVYGRMKRSF